MAKTAPTWPTVKDLRLQAICDAFKRRSKGISDGMKSWEAAAGEKTDKLGTYEWLEISAAPRLGGYLTVVFYSDGAMYVGFGRGTRKDGTHVHREYPGRRGLRRRGVPLGTVAR